MLSGGVSPSPKVKCTGYIYLDGVAREVEWCRSQPDFRIFGLVSETTSRLQRTDIPWPLLFVVGSLPLGIVSISIWNILLNDKNIYQCGQKRLAVLL
jgi:hypothetical protein